MRHWTRWSRYGRHERLTDHEEINRIEVDSYSLAAELDDRVP